MNSQTYKAGAIFLITCILLLSCKDEWENHYSKTPSQVTNLRIVDYISSKPELSSFYQMLTITGYDSILNASQSYTVWVPDNDALQNVDLKDTSLVSDIVRIHVARFSYPTSGIESSYIRMINRKLILFSKDENGFMFGKSRITTPDILTGNGIVHILSGYNTFQNNIWEYIQKTPGMDSLKAYINSQQAKIFDIRNSTAVSIDSKGNSVYDSVFIQSNLLFNQVGELDSEDSLYTAVLPTNTAWKEAYNRVKNYFVSNHLTNAAAIQQKYTKLTIVKDMVFRNRIQSPNTLDSAVSSTGTVFHQPSYLFNAAPKEVSNGIVYPTDQMQFKSTDSWHVPIRVEAEYSSGRTYLNSNIYLKYSFGSPLNVSNKGYIVVEPVTTSSISKVYVDFSIPGTLSAKYNVYCTFVPGNILNVNDTLPNRVVFSLVTVNETIGPDGKKKLTPVVTPLYPQTNVTDRKGITKILVAKDMKLPYCDRGFDPSNGSRIKLRVQNDVGIRETNFTRTMRIDYVLFEPVSE